MKKCKLVFAAILIFILSAQPVFAAEVSKPVAISPETENSDGETLKETTSLSENVLETESDRYYFQGAVEFNNIWNERLTDINGNPVSLVGEANMVKIILAGYPLDNSQTIDSIRYLESQFGSNPRVSIIVVDADGNSLSSLKGASAHNFSKTVITSTGNDDFWSYMSAVLAASGCPSGAGIIIPPVYVVDSNNHIRYISSGYYSDQLAPLANYVKGMDEVTGINEVRAFVNRLYAYALGRTADEAGLNDWTNKLMNKERTGTEVAVGFFFSDEMNNRNLSNEEFVELLYKVMMNRSSDAEGKAYWLDLLNNGVSRRGVFNGFAGSTEFSNICNYYGINRGTATATEGRDKNYGATLFVSRLYTQALGRDYDVAGLNDWCNRIVNGTWSVTDVSTTGFFHSKEFENKNLSNEEYVKVLYRTFLGREYDQAGLDDWVGQLNSGAKSRDDVLRGFSYSREFSNIMKQYGL